MMSDTAKALVVVLVVAAIGGYIALLKVRLAGCQSDKAQIEAAHKILVATVQLQNNRIAEAGKATEAARARGAAAARKADEAAKGHDAQIARLKAAQEAATAAGKGSTCTEALAIIRGGL